ncbi:MAG: alpha/beta hydrolase [Acidobacteria bacterium]|nr:alpha/beta hydrolase [Acidobacteriota bacterium]
MALAPPGQLVDIGTHRLHLRCAGEGTPAVVFDAALGASSLSWSLVAPRVAAVTRACTYDRAGFGWSEAGPLPRTAARIADELDELLRRAAVPRPCVLVGHSFGGFVMRLLAARHPDAAAALILLEPAHPEEWVQPSEEQRRLIARGVRLCGHGAVAARLGLARAVAALVSAGALGAARALVRLVSRGGLRREDEEILAPIGKLPPDARAVLRRMWTEPRFFEALGSQIASVCESAAQVARAAPEHYGDLPLVVLTSAGAGERRMHADAALAQRSSRGRHIIVHESGHWLPLDAPQAVAEAIANVVQEIRALRSA